MPQPLLQDQIQSLFATLQAPMLVACYGPSLRVIATDLPGKAVCAVLQATDDGITRVVYDPSKPHALWHTRAMLRGWWTGDAEACSPSMQPDSVEFLLSSNWRPGPVPLERSDEGGISVRQ